MEAPNGDLAAFCTIWFDDVNRAGVFEPVGTAPEYQRRGLGRVLLYEGMRRLRAVANTTVYVGCGESALPFYTALGFQTFIVLQPWRKEWRGRAG